MGSTGRPPAAGPGRGVRLRHLALNVTDLGACERFYVELLGLDVEWRPDPDNVYLTSGSDNLALHRVDQAPTASRQSLDHMGFALDDEGSVDDWHDYLSARGVPIVAAPRTHRDGSRSFYCRDPEGNTVQFLHLPSLGLR